MVEDLTKSTHERRQDDIEWRREIRDDITRLFNLHAETNSKLVDNTVITKRIEQSTSMLVEVTNNIAGFLRFVGMIGKWSKWILKNILPIVALIYAWYHGAIEAIQDLLRIK